MPTANPRVNVTLSPSLDSLVTRLAALERVSKSNVLRELLETAEPALQSAVALMEAAQGASADARKLVAKDMMATLEQARIAQDLALHVVSESQRDLVTALGDIRGRRPSRRGVLARDARAGETVAVKGKPRGKKRPGDPPSSNRGVKS